MKAVPCVCALLLALRSAAVSISPFSVVETNPVPDTNFFPVVWTNAAGTNVTGYVALFGTASNNVTQAQLMGSGTNGVLLTTNMDTVYAAIFCYDRFWNISPVSDILPLAAPQAVQPPVTSLVLTADVNVVQSGATLQESPDLSTWSGVAPFFGVIETIPAPPSPMFYRLYFPNGDGLNATLTVTAQR